MDYTDQLVEEKTALEEMISDTSSTTVDDLVANVVLSADRTGAQNVVTDNEDIFGLNIGRPKDPTVLSDYEDQEAEALR